MLKATGVKMECMKEDNDMEKKTGFSAKKTNHWLSPVISGEAGHECFPITVSHFLPDSLNVWEAKVNCEVVWMMPFNNRKC